MPSPRSNKCLHLAKQVSLYNSCAATLLDRFLGKGAETAKLLCLLKRSWVSHS